MPRNPNWREAKAERLQKAEAARTRGRRHTTVSKVTGPPEFSKQPSPEAELAKAQAPEGNKGLRKEKHGAWYHILDSEGNVIEKIQGEEAADEFIAGFEPEA